MKPEETSALELEEFEKIFSTRINILKLIKTEDAESLLALCQKAFEELTFNEQREDEIIQKVRKLDDAAQGIIVVHANVLLTQIMELQSKSLQGYKTSNQMLDDITKYRESKNAELTKQFDHIKELKQDYEFSLKKLRSDNEKENSERDQALRKEFEALKRKISSEWEGEKDRIGDLTKELEGGIQRVSEQHSEMQEALNQTLEYFSITESIFKTGGFQVAANNETRQANRYRALSISLMLMVTALIGYIILSPQLQSEPLDFVYRFLLIFTLLMPAGYAAREAGRHRTNSEMYRLAGIEMSTIDTFLGEMEKENKDRIKEILVDRYFGHFRFVGQKPYATNVDDMVGIFGKLVSRKKDQGSKEP